MGQAVAAAASIGTQVVGTGLQLYGQAQQQKAAKKEAKYNAKVAKRNAARSEIAAKDAEARGKRDAARAQAEARRLKGRQAAVLAANGVDVGDGSALDIFDDTKRAGMADALTIRENAKREADDYRAQGESYSEEAAMARKRAKNSGDYVELGSTFLTNTTAVASKWYDYSKEGVF